MFLIDQLIVLFLLSLVGDPLRNLFSIKIKYLENLDLFQVLLLDFFLGAFIFYVIALIPLGFFTRSTVFFIIFITLILGLFRYGRDLYRKFNAPSSSFLDHFTDLSARAYLFISIKKIIPGLIVVLLFIIIFWIESESTVGTLFGNVHDASLFSMLIKLISENGMIPATLIPFEASGIIYPQGFTVICVFSTYILNSEPENIILLLVPLFQALTIIGAYSLGKSWGKKNSFGVFVAFIFVFVSRWPKLLVWGSYAFVAAFPLYLLILGFIPFSIDFSDWKKQKNFFKLLFFGLIVGYLGAIHAVYYEVVISTIILLFIIKFHRNQKAGLPELPSLFTFLIFSLLPVSIFFHRFIVSAFLPGQNIGLPIDIIAPKLPSLQENLWTIIRSFFVSDWISPYLLLRILTFALISASFIWMGRNWRRISLKKWKCSIEILICSFLGIALIILLGSKETGLSFFVTVINIPETAIILFVSTLLLMSISIFENFTKIHKFQNKSFSKHTSVALLAVIFILLFFPFIFHTLQSDVKYSKGVYNILAVTTPEDYELMKRIENKLPENSSILINPNDAGGFLPTIAGYKVIYPLTGSRASISYNELNTLILQKNLNQKYYELLDYFNISHLFVGSTAVSTDVINGLSTQEWNPMLFLANPNFNLIENLEKTYIFQYDPGYKNCLFLDDFEVTHIEETGWKIEIPKKGEISQILLSSETHYLHSGEKSLMITTQAHDNSTSLIWLSRQLFLPEESNRLILEFYLASPKEFQESEGLTFIFSDETWEKNLFISTWNRDKSLKIDNSGLLEFDLSSLWSKNYNSSLPRTLNFQIEVFDLDGSKEIFYVDSIKMRIEPT